MEVILQEDIPTLGKAGEVVRVKDGYARNFLLPRGKAVLADRGNLRAVEHQQHQATIRQTKLRAQAEALGQQIARCRVNIQREAGPEGKLFGSVTTIDIADAVRVQGVTIDRRQLKLPEPIKQIGEYTVEVRLAAGVAVTLSVTVTAK